MSIGEDVTRLIESWKLPIPNSWDSDTSLIRSGIVDSVALLELVFWIEKQIGRTIDPTQIDLFTELDSIKDIEHFIESNRAH